MLQISHRGKKNNVFCYFGTGKNYPKTLSSCFTDCTDFPDSLSLSLSLSLSAPIPVIYRSWTASRVRIALMYISPSWLVNTIAFMYRGPGKNVTYVSPCFSSSDQHILFVLLGWFLRWEVSGCTPAVLWVAVTMVYLEQYVVAI